MNQEKPSSPEDYTIKVVSFKRGRIPQTRLFLYKSMLFYEPESGQEPFLPPYVQKAFQRKDSPTHIISGREWQKMNLDVPAYYFTENQRKRVLQYVESYLALLKSIVAPRVATMPEIPPKGREYTLAAHSSLQDLLYHPPFAQVNPNTLLPPYKGQLDLYARAGFEIPTTNYFLGLWKIHQQDDPIRTSREVVVLRKDSSCHFQRIVRAGLLRTIENNEEVLDNLLREAARS